MARGIKISQLEEFTNSDGSEYLTAVKAGVTKRIQIQNIAVSALGVSYDNTISGLSAINVKAAIDELESSKIGNTEKGSINGVASLDGSGKIITSQIPAISIVDTYVVVDQTEQLALSAQQGDIAIRSDESKTYVHNGGSVGDMTDWNWMVSPGGGVLSVNGETGVVTGMEEVVNRQNTITDDDSKYPSSGAVVDHVNTHTASISAHHNSLSDSLDITPNSVNSLYFASTRTSVGQVSFGAWLTGDTVYRFYIKADGTMEWGPGGASARDTSLYRANVNTLMTDSSLFVNNFIASKGASGGAWTYLAKTEGDSSQRWGVAANGTHYWSDGAGGGYDTNLYRDSASSLKTDDTFRALNLIATNGYVYAEQGSDTQAFGTKITGDSWWRWRTTTTGNMEWGPGDGARDVNLYRGGANTLHTDGSILSLGGYVGAQGASGGSWGFITHIVGDTSQRLGIQANGAMKWSDGAGGGYDTNLYRDSANLLRTDDTFRAGSFDVNGTVNGYTHNSTSKYMTVAASAFEGHNSALTDTELWGSPARLITTSHNNTCYGQADIQLPHGAVVTRIDAYGSTSSGTSRRVDVTLRRMSTSNSNSTMASCYFNNGGSSANDTSISYATIDNNNYTYGVEAKLFTTTSTADAVLFWIKITYTVVNVGQTI